MCWLSSSVRCPRRFAPRGRKTSAAWILLSKLLSPNDSICVSAFEDPKVPGVTCHISQARKGGWGSVIGLTEDPSRFSIACRQTGPIALPNKLPNQENVFSEKTSIFFKSTK
ncbi:MAG: CreA family protein [Syntrophobacteraceae bacterium]